MKSWKIFLESKELNVSYLQNIFSELEDEFGLRCIQNDVITENSLVEFEDASEFRGLIDNLCDKVKNLLYVKKDTLLLKYHESYGYRGDSKPPPTDEKKAEMKEYVKGMKSHLIEDGYLIECRCSLDHMNGSKGELKRFQIFIMIVIQKA